MVQNAVEHGFKTLDTGRIHICLEEHPKEFHLHITNDGEPLPAGFKPKASDSLGLSIVETLVRGDLSGQFTLENAPDGNSIVATVVVPR